MANELLEKLKEYSKGGYLAMHMPGHKRKSGFLPYFPAEIDITEIDGFDNLHDMTGVLLALSKKLASLYRVNTALPLVGGSTCGILAAVTAAAKKNAALIMARNCHKAVYNAARINRLIPKYIYPEEGENGVAGEISVKSVKEALKNTPSACALVLTSPTFEGKVSDIKKISALCREHGVKLIVDSAHGAHFSLHEAFPENAVSLGADYAVISLHKTLPAPTSCASVLTDNIDDRLLSYCVSLYETSSPSFVFLAAIESCTVLLCSKKEQLFSSLICNLTEFYNKTAKLKALKVFYFDDPSRIIVSTRGANITSAALADILRKEYRIEPEMCYTDYIVMISTVCDSKEDFLRLSCALKEADALLLPKKKPAYPPLCKPKQILPPFEADFKNAELLPLSACEGRISSEYAFAYPPGCPLICPGELIDKEVLNLFSSYKALDVEIKGCISKKEGFLYCLKN